MMKKIRYTRSRLREKMLLGVAMIAVVLCGLMICGYMLCIVRRRGTVVSARKVVIVVLGLGIH
jgi:hypothetical protein